MSWGVSAIGSPAKVREKLAADFAGIPKMHEPEQSAKERIAAIVDETLAVYPDDLGVRVEANGTQYSPKEGKQIHGCSLKIESLHLVV